MNQRKKVYYCNNCGRKELRRLGNVRIAKKVYDKRLRKVWICKSCGFAITMQAIHDTKKIIEKLNKIKEEFPTNSTLKAATKMALDYGIKLEEEKS